MVQAVIFDMDGLMVDSEKIWGDSWYPAFEKYGFTVPPELIAATTGTTKDHSLALVLETFDNNPDAAKAFDEHYALAEEYFIEHGAPKKPGLDELLAYLEEKGIPCAVASSSPKAIVDADLEHAGVTHYFSALVTKADGLPSKPAPDVFLEAARQLGVEPSQTLVLEDSRSGIQAAATGGFIPVMVPDTIEPDDELRALSHRICESLLEVRDLLAADEL